MISIYTGTPGSGKSLHLASKIYNRLVSGSVVICNFKINLDFIRCKNKKNLKFIELDNSTLTPEKLIRISEEYFSLTKKPIKENSIFLAIDEAQIIFNSREWMTGVKRKEWLSFFSQHRKFGYEIILIAQYDGMIDKQIRSVIEYNFLHRKASNFGLGGKFISLLGGGSLFVAVKMWYPLQQKVGTEFFRMNKKFYRIYDTFANFTRQDPAEVCNLSFFDSAGSVRTLPASAEALSDSVAGSSE